MGISSLQMWRLRLWEVLSLQSDGLDHLYWNQDLVHSQQLGAVLRELHSAFLEGACLGVMGTNMPVFTPVAAVWALHTGQT